VVKRGVRHRFLNILWAMRIRREASMAGMEPNQQRSQINPGIHVRIVLKQNQRSDKMTEGTVKSVLANSSTHPRGIKGEAYRRQSRQSTINNKNNAATRLICMQKSGNEP